MFKKLVPVLLACVIGVGIGIGITYFNSSKEENIAVNSVSEQVEESMEAILTEATEKNVEAETELMTEQTTEDASVLGEESTTPNQENESRLSLTYTDKVRLSPESSVASIMFQNPSKSTHAVTLSIQMEEAELIKMAGSIQDATVTESADRLTLAISEQLMPGDMLTEINLSAITDSSALQTGSYQAVYWIELYDMKSGQKIALNTQIPVEVIVE